MDKPISNLGEVLPLDFQPRANDVICARGLQALNHSGYVRILWKRSTLWIYHSNELTQFFYVLLVQVIDPTET
jgi:hypothetical protein